MSDATDTTRTDADRLVPRLDALELQAMDAEVAQAALDAVVVRHGRDIAALQRAIEVLGRRVETLASQGDATGGDAGAETSASLSEALERERPPHY